MARTVLIADDSPTIQKKASGILTGEGMEVVTVSNGVAAIKKLPTVKPSVILADISMPGKDGYEVCEFVKGSADFPNVPVLLIFSDDDIYDEQKGRQARADGRIRKPFDRDDLVTTVSKYLAIAEAAEPKPRLASAVVAPPAPPPAPVLEPMDEEPEAVAKPTAPDFSQFGEGVAFGAPAPEELETEPAPALEYAAPAEPPQTYQAEPAGVEEPIIEPEVFPQAEPPSEFEAEIPPAPVAAHAPEAQPDPVEAAPTSSGGTKFAPAFEPEIGAPFPPEPPGAFQPLATESPVAASTGVPVFAISDQTMPAEPTPAPADPVFIEEASAAPTPPIPAPAPVAERTMMFRVPADIAQPVLQDDLAPAPPEPPTAAPEPTHELAAAATPAPIEARVGATAETGPEPLPVSATTLDSYSLSEAAAGHVRFAPVESSTGPASANNPPAPAADAVGSPPEAAAMTAVETAPSAVSQTLDPAQVFTVVYMVVAKMSPRMSPQAIEEMARNLTDEISAELSAPPPPSA